MYQSGLGVPSDFIHAYMWYTVAASAWGGEAGNQTIKKRGDIGSRMTAAQIEKAEKMAQRCQQSKFKECD